MYKSIVILELLVAVIQKYIKAQTQTTMLDAQSSLFFGVEKFQQKRSKK